MTEDQAFSRWFRAVEQARKLPGGYVTLPSSVIVALADLMDEAARELEASERAKGSGS